MIYIHATGDFPFGRCTKREKKRKKQSVKKKKKNVNVGNRWRALHWELNLLPASCWPPFHILYSLSLHKTGPRLSPGKTSTELRRVRDLTTGLFTVTPYHGGNPPPSPERTIHTWAVVHTSRIHSPAPRQTQIDTHADGRTHTRTDAAGRKKTNTHRGLVS